MPKSLSSARKSLRGRPRVDATPVNTRFPPDELEALDVWISKQDEELSRPEAVRRLVKVALAAAPKRGRTK
jgi:hypothetical protein